MKNAFAPALLVLALTILSAAQTQTAKPLSVALKRYSALKSCIFLNEF